MSHHPARRARTVTAAVSAAAFAGIVGGLAATHASASSSTRPASSSPATTAPATGPAAGQSPEPAQAPDDGGWTAQPAPSGSLGFPQQSNHGQSGAS